MDVDDLSEEEGDVILSRNKHQFSSHRSFANATPRSDAEGSEGKVGTINTFLFAGGGGRAA